MGPVAAVERLRLSRAEGLLSRSNLSVSAIAAECGFSDAYHFSRRFRAVNGCSPRQFRIAEAPPAAAADLFPLERHVWRERR
jgi:transcriptional regulator GlxA family with amidase domain